VFSEALNSYLYINMVATLQHFQSAKAFLWFPQQCTRITTNGSNLHLPLRYKPFRIGSFVTNTLAFPRILASSYFCPSLSMNRYLVTSLKPFASTLLPLAYLLRAFLLPAVSSVSSVCTAKIHIFEIRYHKSQEDLGEIN